MTLTYDPDSNTVFDSVTGQSIATLDDGIPRDQRHTLGRLFAASLDMRDALEVMDSRIVLIARSALVKARGATCPESK